MKKISQEEFNKILEKHNLWLLEKEDGEKADLRGVDLCNVNLCNIDLRYADLKYANLWNADLKHTNLCNADLWNANLKGANLKGANLKGANLKGANLWNANLICTNLICANLEGANLWNTNLRDVDLRGTNLEGADLKEADLRGANLRGTNLRGANLRGADLRGVKTNINTIGYSLACPEEGSFIGYKKANGCIVKLLILESSKRSSATTVKCRCDKAKVLEIKEIETGKKVKRVSSDYDFDFIYEVGRVVSVDDFDEDRWNECSMGIHFFINKENALNY